MNTAAKLACIVLVLALAACTRDDHMAEDTGRFDFGRNTSFDGEVLRIELARKDGGKETFSTP